VTTDDRTDAASAASAVGHIGTRQYEIRVRGHLGPHWAAWFDGLTVVNDDDGTTVIHGPLVDQAALHGVLQKLRDVGIPLVSLRQLPPDAPTAPRAPRIPEGN
jgi:hypothetical protein